MRKLASPAEARSIASGMRAYRSESDYSEKVWSALRVRAENLVASIEACRSKARAPHMVDAWAEAESDVRRMLAHLID